MKKVIAIALLSAYAVHSQGSTPVYRCQGDQGQTVFSQVPCGDDAVRTDINGGSAGNTTGSTSAGDRETWQRIAEANEVRDLRRAIGRHQRRIEALRESRDREMERLRQTGDITSNTPPGMTFEQGLQPQLDQLSADYQARVDEEQDKITALQARIDNLLGKKQQGADNE